MAAEAAVCRQLALLCTMCPFSFARSGLGGVACLLADQRVMQVSTQSKCQWHCRSKSSKAQQKGPALSSSELEQKKRREQMAAAAEARMVKLKASAQQNQLWQQQ